MAFTLLLRRGLEANRTSIVPSEGEPIYTTDEQKLYIGDSTTSGGVLVGDSAVFAEVQADGTGDIGIGTTLPDAKLHVLTGDTTVVPDANADEFMIESTADGGMTIATPNANVGVINFADPDDSDAGYIEYDHNTNELAFGVNATEAMTINSSGTVVVGSPTTVRGNGIHIFQGDSSGINPNVSVDDLVIEGSGSTGITIMTPNANEANIAFADPEANFVGGFTYTHSIDRLSIFAGGSNPIRITSNSLQVTGGLTVTEAITWGSNTTVGSKGSIRYGNGSGNSFVIAEDGTTNDALSFGSTLYIASTDKYLSTGNNIFSASMYTAGSFGWDSEVVSSTPFTIDSAADGNVDPAEKVCKRVNATSGNIVVNLPESTSGTNKQTRGVIFEIVKTDSSSNTVTIAGHSDSFGDETINGSTTFVLTEQYESVLLRNNSGGWDIISHYVPTLFSSFGADTQVAFWSGTRSLEGSDTFVFDGTNVGINKPIPSYRLDVVGSLPLRLDRGTVTGGFIWADFDANSSRRWRLRSSEPAGGTQYAWQLQNSSDVTQFSVQQDGSIGIGTSTSATEAKLHVRTSTLSGTVAANGDELLLESSGNTGMTIRSGNTSFGSILFGDDGDNNIGRIRYNHSTNRLQFFTNDTEQARIGDGAFWLVDGVTAPGTTSGFAKIYVDTADGDLKIRFGDGTIKTIVTDT